MGWLKSAQLAKYVCPMQRLIVKHIHFITIIRNHALTAKPQRANTEKFKQQLLLPK